MKERKEDIQKRAKNIKNYVEKEDRKAFVDFFQNYHSLAIQENINNITIFLTVLIFLFSCISFFVISHKSFFVEYVRIPSIVIIGALFTGFIFKQVKLKIRINRNGKNAEYWMKKYIDNIPKENEKKV